MVHKALTVILVTLIVYLDVSLRGIKERIGVLEQEVISQQQYIEAFHGALINHRNNIEDILETLKNWII